MERGHGRLERRACTIMRGTNGIRDQFAPDRCWAALGCAVRGHTTRSVCYYISSRPVDTEARLELVRGHWGVENSLHRTLDVQFRGTTAACARFNRIPARMCSSACCATGLDATPGSWPPPCPERGFAFALGPEQRQRMLCKPVICYWPVL
ncbi:MAG: hypothetical protein OXC13_08540 [Caldilineaceae bacterium]|nr:hypothetical protein [Caldilineaceae bacterium]